MNANLMDMYGTVGTLAKARAEAAAATSARVAGVMQDGYRRWFDGVNAVVGESTKLMGSLGTVRNAAEVIELQRAWFDATSTRMAADFKAFIELSSKLVAESAPALPAPPRTTMVAAPMASEHMAPEHMAAEPTATMAASVVPPEPLPVAEPAAAMEPVASKPVASEPVAVADPVAVVEPVAAAEPPMVKPAPAPRARRTKAATTPAA